MDPILNEKVWDLIDSYFKTINRNLVNHQLDSYNMFIMSQLPRTIRQFNPMQLVYTNDKGEIDLFVDPNQLSFVTVNLSVQLKDNK